MKLNLIPNFTNKISKHRIQIEIKKVYIILSIKLFTLLSEVSLDTIKYFNFKMLVCIFHNFKLYRTFSYIFLKTYHYKFDQIIRVFFEFILQRIEVFHARKFGVHIKMILLKAHFH